MGTLTTLSAILGDKIELNPLYNQAGVYNELITKEVLEDQSSVISEIVDGTSIKYLFSIGMHRELNIFDETSRSILSTDPVYKGELYTVMRNPELIRKLKDIINHHDPNCRQTYVFTAKLIQGNSIAMTNYLPFSTILFENIYYSNSGGNYYRHSPKESLNIFNKWNVNTVPVFGVGCLKTLRIYNSVFKSKIPAKFGLSDKIKMKGLKIKTRRSDFYNTNLVETNLELSKKKIKKFIPRLKNFIQDNFLDSHNFKRIRKTIYTNLEIELEDKTDTLLLNSFINREVINYKKKNVTMNGT